MTGEFARQKRVKIESAGELPYQSWQDAAAENSSAPQERAKIAFPGKLPQPERTAPVAGSKSAPKERQNTAISVFNTRSWSLWLEKEQPGQDPETGEAQQPAQRRLGFLERMRKDRVLHFVLALITTVGLTLIIAGVVYEETHGNDPKEVNHR